MRDVPVPNSDEVFQVEETKPIEANWSGGTDIRATLAKARDQILKDTAMPRNETITTHISTERYREFLERGWVDNDGNATEKFYQDLENEVFKGLENAEEGDSE